MGNAWAINPFAPHSLKLVPVIEPPDLDDYLNGSTPAEKAAAKAAAIVLGKALFWDLQVGSDGKTSCSTCHFDAGMDRRTKNTLNPGFNKIFNVAGPNADLDGAMFPFHQRFEPDFQVSPVKRDSDDVVGSQGVRRANFNDIRIGNHEDDVTTVADPVFNVNGKNTRQVTGRNTPTVFNAAYSFTSFWDGRANNIFNGVNPFGPADENSKILVDNFGNLTGQLIRIRMAALASQAVDPPVSDIEMSATGRTWPKIGKKMLSLKPLGRQGVATDDSVLGQYSDAPNNGLNTTYAALIQAAFAPRFSENTSKKIIFSATGAPTIVDNVDPTVVSGGGPTDQFTQMEANFSLFFGLAIMLYENTLLANDTPFDQFQEGLSPASFGPLEQFGLEVFMEVGCSGCHGGPEFTAHNQIGIQGIFPAPANPMNAMAVEIRRRFGPTLEDEAIYNIGVRPTKEDLGRAGSTPPLDLRPKPAQRNRTYPLSFAGLALLKPKLSLDFAAMMPSLPAMPPQPRTRKTDAVKGAFKLPTLRNAELTGPYFHNGSVGTLAQVVDFYSRGGNFPRTNARNLNPLIIQIPFLQGAAGAERMNALVAFLLALTDERVRYEKAPFDHPGMVLPVGQDEAGNDIDVVLPPIGKDGDPTPLGPFLDLDPFDPGQ